MFHSAPGFPLLSQPLWMVLFLLLVCMHVTWTDLRQGRIRNVTTAILLIIGLGISFSHSAAVGITACVEVASILCGLVLFVWAFKRLRGQSGLGGGDIKFLVASTPWLELVNLPWMILLSCISALATAVVLRWTGQEVTRQTRLAFGPHLALGLMTTWIWKNLI